MFRFASRLLPALLLTAGAHAGGDPLAAVRAELAPTGQLRAAINYGNAVLAQHDAASGRLSGVTVDLAHELGRQLGLPVKLVGYDAAGKVFQGSKQGEWDVAFLAVDPERATEISFTTPYVLIEGAYLVSEHSPLRTPADVDRPGLRVAVGEKSAYDLFLTRHLQQAELVRTATSAGTLELFFREQLDAVAGVKQLLQQFARDTPGLRLLDESFMQIKQAMGTPKGRPLTARYLQDFIEAQKANGFIREALLRHRQDPALVAPPAPR